MASSTLTPCPIAKRATNMLTSKAEKLEEPVLWRSPRVAQVPTLERATALYDDIRMSAGRLTDTQMRDFAGPIIRLAFHDALSWQPNETHPHFGGVDGSIHSDANMDEINKLRYTVRDCIASYVREPYPTKISTDYQGVGLHFIAGSCADLAFPETHSLAFAQIASEAYCEPYEEIGWADCWMFVASVFLEACGGPMFDLAGFKWGRKTLNHQGEDGPDASPALCEPGASDTFDALWGCFSSWRYAHAPRT